MIEINLLQVIDRWKKFQGKKLQGGVDYIMKLEAESK